MRLSDPDNSKKQVKKAEDQPVASPKVVPPLASIPEVRHVKIGKVPSPPMPAEEQAALARLTAIPAPEDLMSGPQIQSNGQQPSNRGLEAALRVSSPEVREALHLTHEALNRLGIPHVLIGGLAVGANGFPHFTDDLDYLVQQERAFNVGVLLTFREGVPIRSGQVAIDYLTIEGPEVVQRRMMECLERAAQTPDELTYAPEDLLTYMKLKAGRLKDITAIVELLKAGMDPDPVQAFLEEAADEEVLARFRRCLKKATEEQ